MNPRKANETLYQNNTIELSDEALAKIIGGCEEPTGYEQSCQQYGGYGQNQGYGRDRGRDGRDCGLLGDLLGDLL